VDEEQYVEYSIQQTGKGFLINFVMRLLVILLTRLVNKLLNWLVFVSVSKGLRGILSVGLICRLIGCRARHQIRVQVFKTK